MMAHIYLAMVDTPGIFAALIRRFLGEKYIHVVLSMDRDLEEAYSFGRRNPRIPLSAGFEREDKRKILRAFPTADYMVCELTCSAAQKEAIRRRLAQDYRRRWHYHYAVIGLAFIVRGIPFYQKNHYTCSSYIARVLAENGIHVCDKHFSLVTPKDFCHYADQKVVFAGSLRELVEDASAEGQENPANKRRSSGEKDTAAGLFGNISVAGRLVTAYGNWF